MIKKQHFREPIIICNLATFGIDVGRQFSTCLYCQPRHVNEASGRSRDCLTCLWIDLQLLTAGFHDVLVAFHFSIFYALV